MGWQDEIWRRTGKGYVAPPNTKPAAKPFTAKAAAKAEDTYVPTRRLASAPSKAVQRGVTIQHEIQQGDARTSRPAEIVPSTFGKNLFDQVKGVEARPGELASGFVQNENRGRFVGANGYVDVDDSALTRGTSGQVEIPEGLTKDLRPTLTAEDWLFGANKELRTENAYKGQTIKDLTTKQYLKRGELDQLAAQSNSMMDEALALDLDMYAASDKNKDGRTTWGEVGEGSKQKGARKTFEQVYGRPPTDDDTYSPNLTGLAQMIGAKNADLYTRKNAQDMAQDLYLDEGDVARSTAAGGLEYSGGRQAMVNNMVNGLTKLQKTLKGSKGAVVSVDGLTEFSPLDLTQFSKDQRVNLVMGIGEALLQEDPNMKFTLEQILTEKIGEDATNAVDTGMYAAPGEGGIDTRTLADPEVGQKMRENRDAMVWLVEEAAKNTNLTETDVENLLLGKNVPGLKSEDFLDNLDDSLAEAKFTVRKDGLIKYLKAVRENREQGASHFEDGRERKSRGGDEQLRSRLMGPVISNTEGETEGSTQEDRLKLTPTAPTTASKSVTKQVWGSK